VIEATPFLAPDFQSREPKELALLSIISQSFFQPFSVEDNLLVILTALTSGSGVGFNRAMLFRVDGDKLRGGMWLGPRSAEEARMIWEVLSTPGLGYLEIIEHNRWLLSRDADTMSGKIAPLEYSLSRDNLTIPATAVAKRELLLVHDASHEPLVDPRFLEAIGVEEFLCVPLLSKDEVMGEIVLDNAFSREPIQPKDVKLAGLCGLMAANYIYAATLHQKMVEMERMAALGEMAMFITHQIRNPLTAIGGFTDQLLNAPADETKRRRNLEIIRREINRLENVVFKLAHFLKADPKRHAPFDLKPELRSVLQAMELKAAAENRELRSEIDELLPPVLGDPTAVGEALRNLIVNAFEASPPGGRIDVTAERKDAARVVVSVKDAGRGIPPAARARLFAPFYSTKDRGMGLGLLYVKRVMEACGGTIEVESDAGQGTTFRLYFKSHEEGRPEP
jgi:signal transduction histidine kinase